MNFSALRHCFFQLFYFFSDIYLTFGAQVRTTKYLLHLKYDVFLSLMTLWGFFSPDEDG